MDNVIHLFICQIFYKGRILIDTSNIEKYLSIGANDRYWYRDCENIFIELFGAEKVVLVANIFAATSINTSLKANITLFRRAYYEIENNIPVGGLFDRSGKAMGYLPNIKNQLLQIRDGKELTGRKIRAFAAAMSGDPDAVVVDVWLARAFGIERRYWRQKKGAEKGTGAVRSAGVNDKDFTAVECFCREWAAATGYQAREISSMIWAGVRIDQTGDTETHYKELLKNKLSNLFNVI